MGMGMGMGVGAGAGVIGRGGGVNAGVWAIVSCEVGVGSSAEWVGSGGGDSSCTAGGRGCAVGVVEGVGSGKGSAAGGGEASWVCIWRESSRSEGNGDGIRPVTVATASGWGASGSWMTVLVGCDGGRW